eukprot:GEMP01087411.1.p1 GENE.GEMP01087411.1~~GEMP01087411.1.p1  ORF type:complete len:138 (+),score=35.03 GEMP01087411.1:28-441(+)
MFSLARSVASTLPRVAFGARQASSANVTYEVNLKMKDWTTYTEMCNWLRAEHIPEVLESHPGFVDAEIFDVYTQNDSVEVCIQYRLGAQKYLDEYFEHSAPDLRQKGIDRFGGRFEASRRILLSTHYDDKEDSDKED